MTGEGPFIATTLFCMLLVVGVVGYDIYLHPSDPSPAGVALIEVTGEGHFHGEVGTARSMQAVTGVAPFSIEVPYRRGDVIGADVSFEKQGAAKIRVECKTVAKGSGMLVWKVPRGKQPECPP
jgi:hypothetical protein